MIASVRDLRTRKPDGGRRDTLGRLGGSEYQGSHGATAAAKSSQPGAAARATGVARARARAILVVTQPPQRLDAR